MNGIQKAIVRAAASLLNMINEMMSKDLELKRITKTAALLCECGFKSPSLFNELAHKCLTTQHEDGGWVAIVDTMWNMRFLALYDTSLYSGVIERGRRFLNDNTSMLGLWGRSKRDFDRIPVSGIMLSRLPNMVSMRRLEMLERLWIKEQGSLTYKASYTLMAFKDNNYSPIQRDLITKTIRWIEENQREDGSFGPWKEHPAASDTYCTAIALLGLLTYPEFIERNSIIKASNWLLETQLPSGVWPFHEIEDGGSWALRALAESKRQGFVSCEYC
jgi:hypothetical protein